MVYKKYIKRNGKVYGPYIYHSKRVGDKVVSEYRGGLKKSKKYLNFLIVLASVLLVGFVIFLLASSQKEISGQATLGLNANYKPGETLKGKLDLSLKEGEFIPADSQIIIENNGNVKKFDLKDLVSRETSQGEYYIQGKEIKGSGEGYGKQGFSEESQEISFELNIYTEESSGTGQETESEEETQEQEAPEETEQEVVEEETELDEEETQEQETPEETELEEEFEEETELEEEVSEDLEESEEPEEEQEIENSPVTGNFFVRLTGMFLGLNPTGQATLELQKSIEGKVSFGEEFVYELRPGENAELKPLSVRTSSGERLDDNNVKVKIQDNKVIITTNYNEKEKGYGEEFLGQGLVKLSISLNELNLEVQEGDLNIRVLYEDEELLGLESSLTQGEFVEEETEEQETESEEEIIEDLNETEMNKTIQLNETEINETIQLNETINKTFGIMSVEPLSLQEKALLIDYFGDAPIRLVKSEMFKDRLIVGYKLGKYELEFSYDSFISPDLLNRVMENDRVIWLRDLSKSLDYSESLRQEINLSDFTNQTINFTY
jgi:hypothetical protein